MKIIVMQEIINSVFVLVLHTIKNQRIALNSQKLSAKSKSFLGTLFPCSIAFSTYAYKLGHMSFSSLHWDIFISSFQKIPWPSSNYPPWKTFEVRNCENMENTLKIKLFRKSILFCKYLRKGSSDLYEISCGGQFLSCELKWQFS